MANETQKGIVHKVLGYEKVRFALVGALNTIVDFSILFSLVNVAKLPTVVANVISTTVALAVSYALNKRSVFGNTDSHNVTQVVLFVVVTLSGLWILQSLVIHFVGVWLQRTFAQNVVLLIGKLIATLFSLTWNYLWYSRVIFRRPATEEVIK